MARAKAVVAQGREEGVDPFPLYFALAKVQLGSGDAAGAQASLLAAVKYRPADFLSLLYLGQLYSQQQEFDRAGMWFKRAVESNPRSVDALAGLAAAEQNSYHYYEAERAYRRALELAPQDAGVKRSYDELEQKVQEGEADHQTLQ